MIFVMNDQEVHLIYFEESLLDRDLLSEYERNIYEWNVFNQTILDIDFDS